MKKFLTSEEVSKAVLDSGVVFYLMHHTGCNKQEASSFSVALSRLVLNLIDAKMKEKDDKTRRI